MIALVRVALQLLADALRFAALTFRPSCTLRAEILFLRRQFALYQERRGKPRRPDLATLGRGTIRRILKVQDIEPQP